MNFDHISDHDLQDLIDNAQTAETRAVFQKEFDKRYAAAQETARQFKHNPLVETIIKGENTTFIFKNGVELSVTQYGKHDVAATLTRPENGDVGRMSFPVKCYGDVFSHIFLNGGGVDTLPQHCRLF